MKQVDLHNWTRTAGCRRSATFCNAWKRYKLSLLTTLLLLAFAGGARAQVSVPYAEGFENMSSADDLTAAGWISYNSQSGSVLKIETSASNVQTGSKALNMDSYDASNSAVLIAGLPVVDATINTLQITFSYKVSYGSVSIGYLTDADDASTFVSLQDFNSSSSYTTKTVELNGAPATAARIAIKYTNYYRCYIDDIEVKVIPSCKQPKNLTVSGLTNQGATLTWQRHAQGNEDNWVLEYSTNDDFTEASSLNVTGTPSTTLTGLTAGATYYARVKADCGGGESSEWSIIKSFITRCNPTTITGEGWSEHFTGYNHTSNTTSVNKLPDCWNYINTTTYNSYKGYPMVYYSTSDSRSGNYHLRFYSYGGSTSYDPQPQYAILPPMEDLTGKQMTLWAREGSTNCTFKIGTMTDPSDPSTFVAITEQKGLTTSYQKFTYLLSGTNTYIAIMIEAGNTNRTTNSIYIDDITISDAPSCLKPTDLGATASGLNVTLTWNSEVGNYEIAHATDATAAPADNIADTATDETYTMNGLALGDHYFWVRSNCGGGDYSEWVGPLSVHIGYCLPTTSSVDGNGISNVTFGLDDNVVNNDTPKATYADYSSQIGTVQAGVEATVAVTYATGYTYGTIIWVDLDNSLSFEDNEIVYTGTSTSAKPTTLNATFTIPAAQVAGNYRMRIGGADEGFDSYISGSATAAPSACYTGNWACFQDYTLRVLEAPSCFIPIGLTATNVDDNSATIEWTENGSATAWVLQYGTDSEFATYTEEMVSTTPSFNITGLTATTTYYVRVKSECDTENLWSNTLTFSTTAVATAVGNSWSDNFEGTSCGWYLINGGLTNAWTWGEAVNNGGTHALYISNDGGTTNAYTNNSPTKVFAAKLLTFAEGKYEFSYDWNANGENTYDFLRVALVPGSETLTAGTDYTTIGTSSLPSGWIALDGGSKLNQVTDWQNKTLVINVAAGNYYLVVAWRNDTSQGNNPPAAIDNVSIRLVTCPYDVTDMAVSNLTTTGATLTWTAGEATQWQVAYSTDANFEGATEKIVSAASYAITGLQPATHYYARVRAYCGGDDYGTWSAVLQFNTDCVAIDLSNADFTENFDGYTVDSQYNPSDLTLPVCWNYINTCTYDTYKVYPTIYYNDSHTDYANTSPNCLRLNSYYSSYYTTTDPQPQYAILPPMENLAGKQVTLWARGYNSSSTFKIGTMTDPMDASTFVEIAEQAFTSANYSAYQEFEYMIPANTTANYVAIMIDAATSSRTENSVFIDDITIGNPPTCLKPTDLAVTDVTATTVTLSWTNGEEGQNAWQICLNGDEGNLIMASSNPFTVTDISPGTTYTAKVRAYCGADDQSKWSDKVSFTTDCVAFDLSTGNFTENFDSYEVASDYTAPSARVLPNCWSAINTTTYSSYMQLPSVYYYSNTNYANTTPNCLRLYSYAYYSYNDGTTTYDPQPQYAILPQMANLAGKQITLWARGYYTSSTFKIGTMTNPMDVSTFVEIAGQSFTSANYSTYQEFEYMIPENTTANYVAIMIDAATSNRTNNGVFIDDITIGNPPTCLKPTDLTVADLTTTTATLRWTNGSDDQSAWQICLNGDEENLINADRNPFVVTGLTPATTYTAKVRACCSADDQSKWSKTVTFTTDCNDIVVDADHPFTEGFEGTTFPPVCWTNIASADNNNWSISKNYYHNGSSSAYSGYYGDTYLVMPNIQIADDADAVQLSFWSYNNYVSSYGKGKNSVVLYDGQDEIELSSPASVTQRWVKTTIDLTDYIGQTISLAFKYEGNNAHGWFIDDVQVEVIKNITLADNGTDNSTLISNNDGRTANVTLSGRTLWKDGYWNTLCLPFDLALVGSPLEGATVMALDGDNSNLTNGTLTLNFTDATRIEAGKPYIVKWNPTTVKYTTDGKYIIRSKTDWDNFADLVNGGQTSLNAILDADITEGVTEMVGDSDGNPYSGTFDGNGHTLTLNITATENIVAPFRYINGATIKNLTVTGAISNSGKQNGGVAGFSSGNVTISSCVVSASITSGYSGDSSNGGFIAHVADGSATFNNCAFTGSLLGASATHFGGFVGWRMGTYEVAFNSCLFAPTEVTMGTTSSSTFNRNGTENNTYNKCYYVTSYGDVQGTSTNGATGSSLQTLLGDGWEVVNDQAVPKFTTTAVNVANIVDPVFTYVTIDKTPNNVDISDGSVTFTGCYDYQSFDAVDRSILFLGGKNNLYYPESGASIGAFRAYFQLNNGITAGTNGVRAFKLSFGEGEETGISSLTPDPSPKGEGSSYWYTLDGRRLDNVGAGVKGDLQSPVPARLPKGLYIYKGKKVVIK